MATTVSISVLLPVAASEITVSVGAFNAEKDPVAEVGLEVRFDQVRLFGGKSWKLIPALGIMATADGAFYGYGGVRFSVETGANWLWTTHVGAGAFERGSGFDLGGIFEWRWGFELDRRLGNGKRIGVNLFHLSNGGVHARSPSSNSAALTYTF